MKLINKTAIGLLTMYQKTLSPDHGFLKALFPNGYCKFYPSCSQYGVEAFEKYTFLKALGKTSWRVMRCNPWAAGGEDKP